MIAGCGMAGLSLAARLICGGFSGRIDLFDPRAGFGRDRTWCFWSRPGDGWLEPFAGCVSKRWPAWRVVDSAGELIDCAGGGFDYCYVAGDDFYATALAILEDAANVRLHLGVGVRHLRDDGRGVTAATDAGDVRADFAVDARPAQPADARDADVRMRQQFAGLLCDFPEDSLDDSAATLMDFSADVPAAGGVGFGYLLPLSPRRALVEATVFSERDAGDLREAALSEARRRLGDGFAVVHEETGDLPMTTAAFHGRPSANVVRLGQGGGAGKPSSGYAFAAVQRAAARLAADLIYGRPARTPRYRPGRKLLLDRVFLSRLRRDPASAPALFAGMFRNVEPAALVRFLQDQGTLADDLRVIAALPKRPFVVEAARSWPLWLRPRRRHAEPARLAEVAVPA